MTFEDVQASIDSAIKYLTDADDYAYMLANETVTFEVEKARTTDELRSNKVQATLIPSLVGSDPDVAVAHRHMLRTKGRYETSKLLAQAYMTQARLISDELDRQNKEEK